MSDITDLTAAVSRLTSQLQTQGQGVGSAPLSVEDLKAKRESAEALYKIEKETLKNKKELVALDIKNQKEQLAYYKRIAVAIGEGNEGYEEAIAQVKKLTVDLEKLEKVTLKSASAFEKGAAEAENLVEGFLKMDKEGLRFFQTIGNGTTSIAGFAVGLSKLVKSGDLFVSAFQKVIANSINFAFEVDKQNAALKRATGAGNEYAGVIAEAGLRYLEYGINAEDAAKATLDLFGSFRDFTNLSESEQTNIAATTATLEKFGVSAKTTGQILDQATKSLYMNTQEAETLTREAEALARSIGKPISEVAGDLASAAPKLAFYGKQMFDVFAQLERQSKATGLSVDSLLGLVGEKFDTFEGAGQAVGRLNAILGGPYLNSIDMLNATEAERLEMIKQAIDANGVQFDQLNKFEQKAFASALGTDVDTLRRSLNELDPEVQLQAMTQKELAKRAGDARDIMSKLTDAVNSLVIATGPLIIGLSDGINYFTKMIGKIKDNRIALIVITGVIGAAGLALSRMASKAMGVDALTRSVQNLAIANAELAASQAAVNATSRGGTAGGAAGAASTGASLASTGAEAAFFARGGGQAAAGAGAGAAGAAAKLGKGAKFLKFAKVGGPLALLGAAVSLFSNIGSGMDKGEAIGRALLSGGGGLLGGALGSLLGPMGAIGGGIGGSMAGDALGNLIFGKQKVQDASIKMVQFDNKDTFERVGDGVVAAKPDGTLDKAIRDSNKEVVDAISALAGAFDVKVYLGDEELGALVVKGNNSFAGKQAISPFFEGMG
jgi:hypothetical protein